MIHRGPCSLGIQRGRLPLTRNWLWRVIQLQERRQSALLELENAQHATVLCIEGVFFAGKWISSGYFHTLFLDTVILITRAHRPGTRLIPNV